jgi:hypothetical protein
VSVSKITRNYLPSIPVPSRVVSKGDKYAGPTPAPKEEIAEGQKLMLELPQAN